jgi:hypothetical protein
MANNVPVDTSTIGRTAPTAKSGDNIQTGPPEGKRNPTGKVTEDTITAKNLVPRAKSDSFPGIKNPT